MFDNLINSLSSSLRGLASSNPLSSVTPFKGGVGNGASPFAPNGGLSGTTPFGGNAFGSGSSPFRGSFNAVSPFSGNVFGTRSPFGPAFGSGNPFSGNPFGSGRGTFNPFAPPPKTDANGNPITDPGLTFEGGNSPLPEVAKWAEKTKQTFGDIMDPDVMLAVMTNESGGNPNAYNAAGDAYGLFQQVGLGSYDPDTQFAAARKLAQQKLAAIKQAYAANGLAPDARTQARDFALAWAGHFDYQTGRPNPTSRDVGSGQTAEQLAAIFLKNYDAIKQGATAKPVTTTPGTSRTMSLIWGGINAPITQEFGQTDYSNQNPYNYGADFGVGSGHHGLDIGLQGGTRLYAPVSGTITIAGGSGYYTSLGSNPATSGEIRIRLDNGHELILGHTSQVNVRVGQRIKAGDFLGLSGTNNGDHLHLEYRVPDKTLNSGWRAVDPRNYLK